MSRNKTANIELKINFSTNDERISDEEFQGKFEGYLNGMLAEMEEKGEIEDYEYERMEIKVTKED